MKNSTKWFLGILIAVIIIGIGIFSWYYLNQAKVVPESEISKRELSVAEIEKYCQKNGCPKEKVKVKGEFRAASDSAGVYMLSSAVIKMFDYTPTEFFNFENENQLINGAEIEAVVTGIVSLENSFPVMGSYEENIVISNVKFENIVFGNKVGCKNANDLSCFDNRKYTMSRKEAFDKLLASVICAKDGYKPAGYSFYGKLSNVKNDPDPSENKWYFSLSVDPNFPSNSTRRYCAVTPERIFLICENSNLPKPSNGEVCGQE